MTVEQLEAALVAIISDIGVVAKPYPENPNSYLPDAFPGEALVRYTGIKPTARDLATVTVEQVQTFEIVFVSQLLRSENGLYEWLEKVRDLLDGYTIEGAGGHLLFVSEDYLDEYNGTWQFGQKWELKSIKTNEQTDSYADNPLGA